MKQKNLSKIALKVASRHLMSSVEIDLSSLIQQRTLQTLESVNQMEDLITQALRLVQESKQKEHIYSEAGDLISSVHETLDNLKEGVEILHYISSKMGIKKVRNKVPLEVRNSIDKIIKRNV